MRRKKIKDIWRFLYTQKMRKKLIDDKFVIVSSNCIGGCLLHDLGMPLDTPTVNITIPEFCTFCENLERYINLEPKEGEIHQNGYPTAKLGGDIGLKEITINCVHYESFSDFREAWLRRSGRMQQRIKEGYKIILFASDAQLKENDAINRFHNLPYNKICFTSCISLYPEFVIVPRFIGQQNVGDISAYATMLKQARIFEKAIDCTQVINHMLDCST